MSDADQTLVRTTGDDVAYLRLNAPPYNILTCALMDRLSAALDEIASDRSLKAVAITAAGKAFSAGADVGEHRPDQASTLMRSFGGMLRRFARLEVPVVMAVDGAALGGGFELVMMADILLATERATFGQPEIRLGFIAPLAVVRLPSLVGPARAMEITCTGRTYTAEEMARYGMVTRVVPADGLQEALEASLGELRRASPAIMRLNVRTLKRQLGQPFETALAAAELTFLDELMGTEDVREGIASFYEKRRPLWKNR